ncbi:MAG TPA: 4'-phosphopantetheinyl transferase superfamily protein [Longimicrobiales bacterium]|nr:4'-phosphopantetheinyl transferase superfamily protein [Longimicrobiales bacterium]
MRITVRHLDPYPLTFAVARGTGLPEGAMARAAARAAVAARRTTAALVTVSLSHRGGRGAAALAPLGMRVGVDLERTGTVPPARERFFATGAERQGRRCPRDGAVLWALKEAAWKAFRCPPGLAFTDLELEFGRCGDVEGVTIEGCHRPARSRIRRPWPGWVLALVWGAEDA